MKNDLFISAEEIAQELGMSKPYAYKLMQIFNRELKAKGFMTIRGRISRDYFNERFYGMKNQERK
ncbi:MAG: DNA-binding protein [Erysipelotrichaceae bacterium]